MFGFFLLHPVYVILVTGFHYQLIGDIDKKLTQIFLKITILLVKNFCKKYNRCFNYA